MKKESLELLLPKILANFPEVSLIYLFGSQIEDRSGPMSDVDFGVLVDQISESESLRVQLIHTLVMVLHTEAIDLVVLNHAPIELRFAVIARGALLYQRDLLTRVEFEAQTMSRYGDYLPVLRSFRHDILRGDQHGTRVQRYRETFRRTERTLSQVATSARKKSDRF